MKSCAASTAAAAASACSAFVTARCKWIPIDCINIAVMITMAAMIGKGVGNTYTYAYETNNITITSESNVVADADGQHQ